MSVESRRAMSLGATTRLHTDDADKSSSRSAIILLVVVLLVAGYSIRYGLQTLAWAEAKSWGHANPWLLEVPKPLPPPAISADAKGTLIKTRLYEFSVPWKDEPKTEAALAYTQYHFISGQVIVFFDPESQLDTLSSLKNSNPAQYQKFANVFAGHSLDTNYELYQAVYSASPAQMSPFLPLSDALRLNVLVLWKLGFGFDAHPPLYSFEWGPARGIQFGDPAGGGPVALRIFDDRDRQFRFLFVTVPGSGATLTQDDIDFVIQTLKPVPLNEQ